MTATHSVSQPALMRLDEAAEELRVSKSTVRRLVDDGALSRVHVGRRRALRISRADLADYIAKNTRRS